MLSMLTKFYCGISVSLMTAAMFSAPDRALAQPDCKNAMTQAVMNRCAAEAWQTADRELNQVYQALTAKFSGPRRDQLTTMQLSWIKFRDAECAFVGNFVAGGSMQPLVEQNCAQALTTDRTADLKSYQQGKNPAAPKASYQTLDTQLNQLYQRLQKDITPRQLKPLARAEQSWITWRDDVCQFERGNGGNAARQGCLARLTQQRNQQLRSHIHLINDV